LCRGSFPPFFFPSTSPYNLSPILIIPKRIKIELSVHGINEGFFVRSADGSGRFYSDGQFKDYLAEQLESGNEILLKPGESHKYNKPGDAGRS
jgi:hypothetical protein